MKTDFGQYGFLGKLLAITLAFPGCEKAAPQGIHIRTLVAESPTLDVLQLMTVDNTGHESVEFEVSGTRLRWSFDDLDGDGKADIIISSKTHKSYFAKFAIQEEKPRLRLLDNNGISVIALGDERRRNSR